jgi:hypothetical protein
MQQQQPSKLGLPSLTPVDVVQCTLAVHIWTQLETVAVALDTISDLAVNIGQVGFYQPDRH